MDNKTKKKGFDPKQFFINLLLVLGSLAVMFILAEVGLRALGIEPKTATALNSYFQYDPETGWSGHPNTGMRFAAAARLPGHGVMD